MKPAITKLLRIAIPTREGLENKWWHRLIVVLIYGSTIVAFLYMEVTVLKTAANENFKWKSYTYSFEKNYSMAKGKEEYCDIHKNEDTVSVSCGNIDDKMQLLNKIAEAKGELDELMKKRISYVPSENKSNIALKKQIPEDIREEVQKLLEWQEEGEQFYNSMVLDGMNRGDFQNLRVKVNSHIKYLKILFFIFFPIVTTVCWFIFLYSILYRTVLYIIYGSSKRQMPLSNNQTYL